MRTEADVRNKVMRTVLDQTDRSIELTIERAVRAALDLVTMVPKLASDAASLQLRAGVLTGEAAVNLGADGQGMVAGDLVNTASRIQSAAEPGTVFVGDATRRTTDAAIVYEDAGEHELMNAGHRQRADVVRVLGPGLAVRNDRRARPLGEQHPNGSRGGRARRIARRHDHDVHALDRRP